MSLPAPPRELGPRGWERAWARSGGPEGRAFTPALCGYALPTRSRVRKRVMSFWGCCGDFFFQVTLPSIATCSTQEEILGKVATLSPAHYFPFSDSTPGEERVAVSHGSEGPTVRPTPTSPRRTPHPWGPLRAAGPAGRPRKVAGIEPLCGPNAHHVGGDRSGRVGTWGQLLASAQN